MPLNPPDINELRAIVDWVNLTDDVRELSIKFRDVELFISRDRQSGESATPVAAVPATAPAPVAVAPAVAPAPAATPDAPPAPLPSASTAPAGGDLAPNEVLITAPIVGTFYASPKPGDPPFVAVGDVVTDTTVVGIVEVMKLMNNLEAKVDGTVVRILVENEQAVEYGQPLVVIARHG